MFFQPKNSTERTGKEDAFNSSKCSHAFGKAGRGGIAPFKSPLCFLLDARYGLNRPQEVVFLRGVLDVRVDEERVGFALDVLNGYLEAVEASNFRGCDLHRKIAAEVLVDDAI